MQFALKISSGCSFHLSNLLFALLHSSYYRFKATMFLFIVLIMTISLIMKGHLHKMGFEHKIFTSFCCAKQYGIAMHHKILLKFNTCVNNAGPILVSIEFCVIPLKMKISKASDKLNSGFIDVCYYMDMHYAWIILPISSSTSYSSPSARYLPLPDRCKPTQHNHVGGRHHF